jgi:hypothetical protein
MLTVVVNNVCDFSCPGPSLAIFRQPLEATILPSMSDEDWVGEVAGDAEMLLSRAKVDDDEPVNVTRLCRVLTGFAPWVTRSRSRVAMWGGNHRVCVWRGLPIPRARWVICHEIAEWHYLGVNYNGTDLESRCDALGAALVLPRRLMQRAIREHGHRVHTLARKLDVTQALAMLRIGEVDRRPVLLERTPTMRLVRGGLFEWPIELAKAPGIHPVRLPDEGRWGWMAA